MKAIVKRDKLDKFALALRSQMIYHKIEQWNEIEKSYLVYIDCESLREAFYIGRWVGRNCSTDEIIITESSPKGMGLD